MADELGLRQRRLEVELALEAHACRDVAEELLDRRDADRLEHLLAVGVGEGELAQGHGRAMLLVGVDVEQAVDLGGIGQADPDSQPSP